MAIKSFPGDVPPPPMRDEYFDPVEGEKLNQLAEAEWEEKYGAAWRKRVASLQAAQSEDVACAPGLLALPVVAVAWANHGLTTIKATDGTVLAECSGHGRWGHEDEAIAAELVRRVNAHDELVLACQGLLSVVETGVVSLGAIRAARAAIAKASGGAA